MSDKPDRVPHFSVDPDRPGVIRFDNDPLTGMLAGLLAPRIVACVNACAGIPTELLSVWKIIDLLGDVLEEIAEGRDAQ